VGIGVYGIWPSVETEELLRAQGVELVPALSWRTEIVAEHAIDAGQTVGYGRTWRAARRSRIGTLPIGYAEGLPRAAGNVAHALVRGLRVPLVGRVCMDMAFVDLTDVPQAAVGDAVTLIGDDGAATIGVEELAGAAETIGYEIVARLPAHVPRRYAD
jgi:alanine racemase